MCYKCFCVALQYVRHISAAQASSDLESYAGSQQIASPNCLTTHLHEGPLLPTQADLPAGALDATGGQASAAAASTGRQLEAASSGVRVTSKPDDAGRQSPEVALNHDSAGASAEPASTAPCASISPQADAAGIQIQINSTAALRPVPLTPAVPVAAQFQSLGESPTAAPTVDTPVTAPVPSATAITPTTEQGHASTEQSGSPRAALDRKLPGQQQQQTSRCAIVATDDLSELELEADTDTGVLAASNGESAAQPPAPAASQSVSLKRTTSQAPSDLIAPGASPIKKHKLGDGSAHVTTACRSSAQLGSSVAALHQLAMPQTSDTRHASSPSQTETVPMLPSSKPPHPLSVSVQVLASSPSHSQEAFTLHVKPKHITDTTVVRTALPRHPHAGASKPDSSVTEASQQLVLSLPANLDGPSTTAIGSTVSYQMPAALCDAAAKQPDGTAASASTCLARKQGSPQFSFSFAMFNHSVVTLHSRSDVAQSSPVLPSGMSSLPNKAPSSYQPVIEELPCDTPAANTIVTAAAKTVLPSKPAMIIDIDSDDEQTDAANTQPAASAQGRQGQHDSAGQSHQGQRASLSSEPAIQLDLASDAKRPVQGQETSSAPSAQPIPAKHTTPCDTITQTAARQMRFSHPAAPVGIGDIFSSFSALEALSDAEEEEEHAELVAATSAVSQLKSATAAGGSNVLVV